jgi:hypothetical protein
MWEWEDVRMKLLLISIVGVMAAAAFAQETPARRSPEQIFQFLDKDKSGTLSEAEFGALKDKMPTLQARPDAVSVKFKELDKDHNGSLTLEEFRPLMTQGSRRPGAAGARHTRRNPARWRHRGGSGAGRSQGEPAHRGDPLRE